MLKYLFCLGLIGCLGIQSAAFAAPVGGTATSIAAPQSSRTIQKVDDYYYHRHHHHHHHHHHRGP